MLLDFGALFVTMYSIAEASSAVRLTVALFYFAVDLRMLITLSQPTAYFSDDRMWTLKTLSQGLFMNASLFPDEDDVVESSSIPLRFPSMDMGMLDSRANKPLHNPSPLSTDDDNEI